MAKAAVFSREPLGTNGADGTGPLGGGGNGLWLKRLLDLQPDFPHRLYCVTSRGGGLHTRLDPAEAVRGVGEFSTGK
jgi:hypothetical protein